MMCQTHRKKHNLMNFIRNLYLFRHGKTNATDENLRHSLMSGRHLTDEGIAEANRLANDLANAPIDVFYVSPHERSRHTAEIVAEKHPGVPLIIDDRFGDAVFYTWEMDNPEDIKASAETFARVTSAMQDILKTDYKNIAISSHGGITRAILKFCGHTIGGIGTGEYFHLGFDGEKWVIVENGK